MNYVLRRGDSVRKIVSGFWSTGNEGNGKDARPDRQLEIARFLDRATCPDLG
jgi:hypothetical protein